MPSEGCWVVGEQSPDEFDCRWDGAAIPAEHWHFHRRLLARYGMVLAPGQFSRMMSDIRKGVAVTIEQRACGRTIYALRIKRGKKYVHVYVLCAGTHIVTALPPRERFKKRRKLLAALAEPSGGLEISPVPCAAAGEAASERYTLR